VTALSTLTPKTYKPAYPWFGGKSKVAGEVWRRFGQVRNFVDPFFGSASMLLLRPEPWKGTETINDADGFVANFWRAVQWAPQEVAHWADWPVSENDLHARHVWLLERKETLRAKLEGDPEYCDAKIAGWWVWGIACWIGSGWCAGGGPWNVVEIDGARQLVHLRDAGQGVNRKLVHLRRAGQGVNRQLLHLGDAGQGVNRQLLHLGDAGRGVNRQLLHLGDAGRGVNRQLLHLGDAGRGVNRQHVEDLIDYFASLADRLRNVRVCCGDWKRVCGPTPTVKQGLTAVFLDPPYADTAKRDSRLYASDSLSVAHDVREWAIEHGDDPRMRIALCGYDGEHKMPRAWREWAWKANGGYASQSLKHDNPNARRERIWFSPHCLDA
jgi:site-specific DNA-adenine methylase